MELPSSIGEQLEFLSLYKCQNLGELPESIGNLTSLQNLDLSCTEIVKLPDSIKNLKQLKVMEMQHCQIRKLPAGIGMLERLEDINAQGCGQLVGELPTEIDGLSSLSILDVSYTGVCAVPTAINSLTRLQKLDLTECDELQELPKLPPSLNCLRVESRSLRVVPDLSNLTNLVELHLTNGFGTKPAQASNPMQTLNLQGLGKLFKLEKLRLCLSDARAPSTELSCLIRLQELTLSDMDSLDSVIVGPQFTDFKKLSKLCLQHCPLREIQFDGLELLRDLAVSNCNFLEGLSIISSSMRKLSHMSVFDCPELLEIQFLSAMESLERLEVKSCRSLGGLCGLSNVKKLKHLRFCDCNGLRVVEGLQELELFDYLCIMGCRSFEISNVSNLNIPNECWIYVSDCSKLLDSDGSLLTYGDYNDMILGRMAETFNKEDEMEKDSENKTRKRTASKDSETLNKEDEMKRRSFKPKRGQLQMFNVSARPRLFFK